jgi:nucleotide-binding universal stress UspA family protein
MKSVLVATDFSPQSQTALTYVLDLLRDTKENVRILLVNTYLVDFNRDPQELLRLNDELKLHSRRNLESIKSDALAAIHNPLISIEICSHMGSLANVLTNLIEREKIDAIAVGNENGKFGDQLALLLKKHNCLVLNPERS